MGYLTGSNTPQALKAMALVGEHNRTVEYIRNNKNLTPEGKQKQIAANYLQHKQQITALEAEDKAARTSKADYLRRSLFGLSGSSDANATISYRDAQDRVAAIDSEEKPSNSSTGQTSPTTKSSLKPSSGKQRKPAGATSSTPTQPNTPTTGQSSRNANLHNDETSIEGVMNHAMSYTLTAPAEITRHSDGMIENLAAEA